MQGIFKDVKYQIEVDAGDIVISARFPDQEVKNVCSLRVTAEHPVATGTIEKSSFLRFGVANISWHSATIFADAQVDSKLDINTDVLVKVGHEVLGVCAQLDRQTVGIDVLSDGITGVGISLTASNAHIAKVNGTWSLVFNFHATVVGTVLHWNVQQVTANNCKIKILGWEIADLCGTIESKVQAAVQTLSNKAVEVTAPNILKKLEAKINTKVGDVVVIPLKIADFASNPVLILA